MRCWPRLGFCARERGALTGWCAAADRLGVLVAQDMVQVYGYPWVQGHINGNHSTAEPLYYWQDLKALIDGRGAPPSRTEGRHPSAVACGLGQGVDRSSGP